MRIFVMGAGAVGGYFGARLAAAGADVVLGVRGAHLAAIRQNGIRVESPLGNLHLPKIEATDRPADVGAADSIFFLVKLYDTDAAIEAIRPLVGEKTVVISFQNGVAARDALIAAFGAERVAGGTAYISADVREPGVIRHSAEFASLAFGPYAGTRPGPLEALAEAFARSEASYEFVRDIEKRIWEKFIFLSAFSAITSLTRLPIGPILADPETRTLLHDAMRETAAVAVASEPTVDAGVVDARMEFLAKAPPALRSSMLVDLARGKRIEVEGLSGAVVSLGRKLGIPTPVHRAAYAALRPWRNGDPTGTAETARAGRAA